MFYKSDTLSVIIDGPSLMSAAKHLEMMIDYTLFKEEFARRGKLRRMEFHVFVDIIDGSCNAKPLIDWLSYNGYIVNRRAVMFDTLSDYRKPRGSLSVDVALSLVNAAQHSDHVVLVSGDNDIAPAVVEAQRRGARVSLLSSLRGSTPIVGDQLRRQVDNFIELDDLRHTVSRKEVA